MANRIAELEKELSSRVVSNQREKVAENVEYIRCWRQVKQMNDKLIAVENTNETLNAQINDLRRMLQKATKYAQRLLQPSCAQILCALVALEIFSSFVYSHLNNVTFPRLFSALHTIRFTIKMVKNV